MQPSSRPWEEFARLLNRTHLTDPAAGETIDIRAFDLSAHRPALAQAFQERVTALNTNDGRFRLRFGVRRFSIIGPLGVPLLRLPSGISTASALKTMRRLFDGRVEFAFYSDSRQVGRGRVSFHPKDNSCELATLYLSDDYQRRGIATSLFRLLRESVQPGTSLVWVDSNDASERSFYQILNGIRLSRPFQELKEEDARSAQAYLEEEAARQSLLLAEAGVGSPWPTALARAGWIFKRVTPTPFGIALAAVSPEGIK